MSLPAPLQEAIAQELRAYDDATPIERASRVGGGDINQAARVTTARASYFVKWHNAAPPRFFEAEADGLRRLREAKCLRVPEVIGGRAASGDCPAFLVLEWLDSAGGGKRGVGRALGEGLAAQHRHTQATFGLDACSIRYFIRFDARQNRAFRTRLRTSLQVRDSGSRIM